MADSPLSRVEHTNSFIINRRITTNTKNLTTTKIQISNSNKNNYNSLPPAHTAFNWRSRDGTVIRIAHDPNEPSKLRHSEAAEREAESEKVLIHIKSSPFIRPGCYNFCVTVDQKNNK